MTRSERVLWIGGRSGAGKSTVARLLARRHGLRWYSSDTRTWEHRDRALAAGDPDALEWEPLTPEERSRLPAQDQIRLSLDRSAMTIADVVALPDTPAVIAEGTPITPAMVPDGSIAVWLGAATSDRADRNRQRGWGAAGGEVDLIKARELRRELESSKAATIDTTGNAIRQTLLDVERFATAWIERQPRAESPAERRALIREGNAQIVSQYRSGLARASNPTTDPLIRAYDCECAGPGCTAFVDRALESLPEPFDDTSEPILAPGHH